MITRGWGARVVASACFLTALLASACTAVTDFDRFGRTEDNGDASMDGQSPDSPPNRDGGEEDVPPIVDAPPNRDVVVPDGCVASAEICNGEDDDCDGMTDEEFLDCTAPDHATTTCDGSCGFECMTGFDDCNAMPGDGCEEDVTRADRCGDCTTMCSGATPLCGDVGGGALGCTSGCSGTTPTRCGDTCADTMTDPDHCSACGMACTEPPNATATCTAGACGFVCNTGFDDCDGDPANGCETVLATDPANCGACMTSCALAHGATSCTAGTCMLGACDPDFGNCDGMVSTGCETPLNTLASCGACMTACALDNATETCSTGTCAIVMCSSGFGDCNGDARDGCETRLNTTASCGACGMPCELANASESCASGTCTLGVCDPGFDNCNGMPGDGCEARLDTTTNCGACGNTCSGGTPFCGDVGGGVRGCVSGCGSLTRCGTSCVDLNSNLANCGACDRVCDLVNATETCVTGVCTLGMCGGGFGNCDMMSATGCETPLTTLTDCGACTVACTRVHATATCATGVCRISSCATGFGNCDANDTTGCEEPLNTTASCGMCGVACSRTNATATCATGACAIMSCNAGFGNCNTINSDGCEADLRSDVTRCGACTNVCPTPPNSSRTCTTGVCGYTCTGSFQDCNGGAADGCEVNVNSDLDHCGACTGAVCPPRANATRTCTFGSCGFNCNSGFGNCDTVESNGCEVATTNNVDHCGMCGNACPARANASRTCVSGTCSFMCNGGFSDCNAMAGDGCEVNLTTDVNHCGSCPMVCPTRANATRTCSSGACGYTCNTGFADCNLSPTDGCEVNVTSDINHCGGCSTVCPPRPNATSACMSSMCTFTCLPGFGDCDGDVSNGCESNTTNDINHCGACPVRCTAPANAVPICSAGTCSWTCQTGFEDCDRVASNGCEADLNSDPRNCGGCGVMCGAAGVCSGAACDPIIDITAGGALGVATGEEGHSCALRRLGGVACWGGNARGQLGDGTLTSSPVPVAVRSLVDAVAVAASGSHSCAIRSAGGTVCWGKNDRGQLGNGTLVDSSTPVVVTMSSEASATRQIAVGDLHSCELHISAAVACWGSNASGQLGNGTLADATTWVAVSSLPSGSISRLALGTRHSCAMASDGRVYCWGANGLGQLGDGTTMMRTTPIVVSGLPFATDIGAGGDHTCAVTSSGRVFCWGANSLGQIGNGNTMNQFLPVEAGLGAPPLDASAIDCGIAHTCIGTNARRAFCWGANANGQLGLGDTTNRLSPVMVPVLSEVIAGGLGKFHTCVVRSTGNALCWGGNSAGQVGDGTNVTRTSPVPVVGLP